MAIGAVSELLKRGIDIPDEVSVAGFDGSLDCENVIPPLSSVKQPIYQQGKQALLLAADLAEGRKVPLRMILPTTFIARSSCGCLGPTTETFLDRQSALTESSEDAVSLDSVLPEVQEILGSTASIGLGSSSILQTVQEIDYFLQSKSPDPESAAVLVRKLAKMAVSQMKSEIDIGFWRDIILVFFRAYSGKCPEAESFLQKWFNVIQDLLNSSRISEKLRLTRIEQSARYALSEIMSARNIREWLDKIIRVLPTLNFTNFYLIRYGAAVSRKKGDAWKIPEEVRMLIAYDRSRNLKVMTPDGIRMNPLDFVPAHFLDPSRRRMLLTMPLYFMDEQYGYLAIEMSLKEGAVYELLSLGISSAYRGILLLNRLEEEGLVLRRRNLEIENEIMLASRIQEKILPSAPPRPFISFYYKPMEAVGGDFFDFPEFRERDWIGIFIADVSGHGVATALVTSMIKSSILQMRMHLTDPASLLTYLNDALLSLAGGNFVTAFYGIYKAGSREFIYSSAGHNAPYCIDGKKLTQIGSDASGMPLAVIDSQSMADSGKSYRNESLFLNPGSKLLLYTDGLTETRSLKNPGWDFESLVLKRILLENSGLPVQEFVQTIRESLEDFHGSEEFSDDVCFVALEVENPSQKPTFPGEQLLKRGTVA